MVNGMMLLSLVHLTSAAWQPTLRPRTTAHARHASRMVAEGEVSDVRSRILQVAALTDRGQRLNLLVAAQYQEKRALMAGLVAALEAAQPAGAVTEAALAGDWELIFSDVELFRSSPFFLAIEEALNSAPGIPRLGRWLGATDPTKKAEVFFRLHQLQVLSWGVSTVGRIGQTLDFEARTLRSDFDTTIFGLTVVPLVGWGKLLPTFGGRVVTEADQLTLDPASGRLTMELQRTAVEEAPGVPRVPLVDRLLMDRWYPVNAVWRRLPWNGGRPPTCSVRVVYVDETMRVSRDAAGALFIYTRPMEMS